MQLLAAEQDALARKLAAENQARIDEAVALERKLAAEQQATERQRERLLLNCSCPARVARKLNVGWLWKQRHAKRKQRRA